RRPGGGGRHPAGGWWTRSRQRHGRPPRRPVAQRVGRRGTDPRRREPRRRRCAPGPAARGPPDRRRGTRRMTEISVWAPAAATVDVVVTGAPHALHPDAGRAGWWRADLDVDAHGADHAFSIDGGDPLPDPRSVWLPHGVHGPSRTYDHT